MKKIVEVDFYDEDGKVFLDCNGYNIEKGDYIISDGENGQKFGVVLDNPFETAEEDIGMPLELVSKIASQKDIKAYNKNVSDSKEALKEARKLADSYELNMRIIDASYSFDRSQLLFHFLSDTRVDFRELAKKLAQIYKTRIELRQIGVRDKAKMVGGLGPCGRFLCCSSFLTDFNSVSINMAKNQMLALNPTKINGICGRLLCCLGYEDDTYTEMKKSMPSIGEIYKKGDIEGKVISMNLLKKTITIETKNKSIIEVMCDESLK